MNINFGYRYLGFKGVNLFFVVKYLVFSVLFIFLWVFDVYLEDVNFSGI